VRHSCANFVADAYRGENRKRARASGNDTLVP
jgi:hypothetical protein